LVAKANTASAAAVIVMIVIVTAIPMMMIAVIVMLVRHAVFQFVLPWVSSLSSSESDDRIAVVFGSITFL
jgi:hypothetical protein